MSRVILDSQTTERPFSDLENEVITFFVDLVRWFGAPKSLGAIYGLLFVSTEPLCFEQIATRLQLSNGSVSQGLRILKDLGAVKTTFLVGERRDFFVVETQLRQLVSGFLRRRVERQLVHGQDRLDRIFDAAGSLKPVDSSASSCLCERLNLLQRWQSQAKGILPNILELIEF